MFCDLPHFQQIVEWFYTFENCVAFSYQSKFINFSDAYRNTDNQWQRTTKD